MSRVRVVINPPIKRILSTFLDVDSRDVSRIPMEGPLIISTNHINSLDAPVGFSHLHPRPVTAFVKAETWDNWFLKFLFNAWDAIPIKRGEADFEAFRLAEEALKQKATSIILAHNHPGGIAEPSEHDESITTEIQKALALVEISLQDHIILANNEYYSFKRNNQI